LSILSPKFRVFLTIAKKYILRPACILRSFSHQPAEFKPKTVGALNSPAVATVNRSLPGIYPKFPSEPGFYVIHQKQEKKRGN